MLSDVIVCQSFPEAAWINFAMSSSHLLFGRCGNLLARVLVVVGSHNNAFRPHLPTSSLIVATNNLHCSRRCRVHQSSYPMSWQYPSICLVVRFIQSTHGSREPAEVHKLDAVVVLLVLVPASLLSESLSAVVLVPSQSCSSSAASGPRRRGDPRTILSICRCVERTRDSNEVVIVHEPEQ